MLKEAAENYNAAIALDPKSADAYYGRGNVYANSRMFGLAEQDFRKALTINPDHHGAKKSLDLLNNILIDKKPQTKK